MITLKNINLSSIDLSGIDLRGIKLGLGGRGSGSGDGFPVLPGDVTRWHFGGLTNEMMAAMDDPRIEDADHKGRFLSFKNFLWAGMSGVGGYQTDYNVWEFDSSKFTVKTTDHSFKITSISNTEVSIFRSYFFSASIPSYTIRVTGLTDGQTITYQLHTSEDEVMIDSDGIYVLPAFERQGYTIVRFYFGKIQESCNITIEQLPLYPGFILGDGVDDFAVTEKELNFEDTYTVYTAFIPFQNDPARNMILCGKNEAKDFSINYSGAYINFKPSKGVNLAPHINQFMLLVCKRNKDITTIINLSTGESNSLSSEEFIANPGLYYLWRNVTATFHARAAIAGQTICNGYFSTDEDDEKVLNYYKQEYPWLFPDQAWTVVGKTNEDTDRATIANITGNGNNLVLSNFGFAENSGYGLYAYNFNSFTLKDNEVKTTDVKNDSFRIVGTGNGSNVSVLSNTSNSANWKIRVTGMKEGDNLIVGNANKSGDYFTITKDGIYTFQKQYEASSTNGVWYNSAQETDVLVEQIPEYEGYLVTDGVDDGMTSSNFPMGKDFTVVGEWRLISVSSYNYAGILKSNNLYVYNNASTGLNIYVCSSTTSNYIHGVKSLKAIRSDGRVYDENWTEYKLKNVGDNIGANSTLDIGTNKNNFTKIAFKNLEIYNNKILSKEDCIKAYNYLQTLKAK